MDSGGNDIVFEPQSYYLDLIRIDLFGNVEVWIRGRLQRESIDLRPGDPEEPARCNMREVVP